MPAYVADRALLPGGWARDVLLEVDGEGVLARVAPDGAADAERIPGVVLPGVPNLHSHAFQRGMAGVAERRGPDRDTFWSWRETMYRFLGRLGPDDVQAIAAQLYVEMLGAGYTSVAEFHYLHHGPDGTPYEDRAEISLRLVEAAREAGIGLTLLPAVYTAGGFGGRPPEDGQRRFLLDEEGALGLLEALRPRADDDPRLGLGLALHSLRAVPPNTLAAAVEAALGLDPTMPIHIHVAEQEREVEACLAWSGARPVAWLLDHAPVSRGWCLVHCTHLSDAEVERLAASGAVVGLCPTTEANLGDGIFPLADFLGSGGRFGIGSDSHVSVSPVEELRWLEYAQRLLRRERNVAPGARDASTG
ncbi:MAG TPA: formimidoylglutamate deiminase, partial [Longimicrobiales bacterium]|nr:formimidoylglutamate deiminase [Longimicrobiales bacterium]